MRHEKIFKRPDGSKVMIVVRLNFDFYNREKGDWSFDVAICKPNKRKFEDAVDTNGWEFRKLSLDNRVEFLKKENLKIVTKEEVLEVQLELWEKIKPNLNSLN